MSSLYLFLQEEMDYVLLKDVNADYHAWCVRVRVVRFREYLSEEQPPVVQRLDMIFLDEKVNLTYPVIP